MGLPDGFRSPDAARNNAAIEIDVAARVRERWLFCNTLADNNRDDLLPVAGPEVHQGFDRDDLLRRLRPVRQRIPFRCSCDSQD